MRPYEIRIELTDMMMQELLWRALAPNAIEMSKALNDAIEQQHEQLGLPPEGAQLSGISVSNDNGRYFAEISYIQTGDAS